MSLRVEEVMELIKAQVQPLESRITGINTRLEALEIKTSSMGGGIKNPENIKRENPENRERIVENLIKKEDNLAMSPSFVFINMLINYENKSILNPLS